MSSVPRIHIEVIGGVCHVVRKDAGVELRVLDYDVHVDGDNPEVSEWEADDEVVETTEDLKLEPEEKDKTDGGL